MRLKVCLVGLVCTLTLTGAITGCGQKNISPAKEAARADAKSSNLPTKSTPSQQTSKQSESASSFGLPLNTSPSPLEQALNPLAKGNATASGQGPLGAVSPTAPAGRMVPSMPVTLPKAGKIKPEQVLMLVQMRYRSAKTLRTAGQSYMVTKADGKVVRTAKDPRATFYFERPDKIIVSDSNEQLISDGKILVKYLIQEKRYVKTKLDKQKEQRLFQGLISSQQGIRSLGLLMGLNYIPAMSSFKLKESQIGSRPMFVLSMRLKEGVSCPKGMSMTQTLWIGKKDFAIYRNHLIAQGKPILPKGFKGKAPKFIQTTLEMNVSSCQFDSNIPDSKFTFNPPGGVKPADDPRKNYLADKPAPDFAFKWVDGEKKKLSDFKDKTIILDCWALPMCEKHLPTLQKIYEKHSQSAHVISICLNSDSEKVRKYLSEKSLSFPVVYASENIAQILQSKYHLQGLPTIFVIDKSGIVRSMMLGMPEAKDIEAKLDKLN